MKKHINKIILACLAAAAMVCGCIQLHEIVIPSSISTNSAVEIHVKGAISPDTGYGPEGIAISMLVPTEWNITENAEVTLSTSNLANVYGHADLVDEVMYPISDVILPKTTDANLAPYVGKTWSQAYYIKHGAMGNIGGDMEWVTFTNPTKITVSDTGDYVDLDVKIKFTTTDVPIRCKLAFEFAGEKEGWEGVGFKQNIKTATITVGSGAEDYTKAKTTSTTPTSYRYHDFFAVNFVTQTTDGTNALYGEKNIYMNGTVILASGKKVSVTTRDRSTRMDNVTDIAYRKYIYPTHYFGLERDAEISDLYFYFTNEDGSKVVRPDASELGYQFRQASE